MTYNFKVETGVWHSDVISLTIFNLILNHQVMKRVLEVNAQTISIGSKIQILAFVDDIALVGTSEEEMSEMIILVRGKQSQFKSELWRIHYRLASNRG